MKKVYRFYIFRGCFLVLMVISCVTLFAQKDGRTNSFSRALEARVGLTWNEAPLRDALNRLGTQTSTPVWLDRRVDASALISGTFQDATVPQLLRETLENEENTALFQRVELTQLDTFLYVGPADFVTKLRTLVEMKREEAKDALSSATLKRWLSPKTLEWERGATPKTILQELTEARNVKIAGLKNVPHDVWPEKALTEISTLDACVVILGQFGLTLTFDKTNVAKVAPLDLDAVYLIRHYQEKQVSEAKRKVINQCAPGTKYVLRNKKVAVRGIAEVHDFITAGSPGASGFTVGSFTAAQLGFSDGKHSGRTPTGVERSRERFSGPIKAPFLPAMKHLCTQQGLTLDADTDALLAAGIVLDQMVSVELKEATIEEVFQSLATAAGCKAQLRGNSVIVTP